MQPTISIPKHWDYPSFTFGQRTQQGIILGLEYHPADTQLAYEYGHGWRYAVMAHNHSDEVRYYSSDQIQTLSVADLKTKLQSEIDQHQLHIMILQQQLTAIKRGEVNGK
ncbi:hypothetical protein H6G76_34980 [Nostoc sp. FACHB-152]|uniref:hypothetical protein n=1 Tax=Nostoc sp. FACHB-152 TaxID=2692837 RepID=UPI0016839F83|nr:hypothetical protein [Nostoc sp. FACHB-152]MBD2452215.1 hypothetical protein [Nostoc sp. FACHB-152]